MMRGTKRFAGSDSNPVFNDSVFNSKRVLVGSPFDASRAEPSQQPQLMTPPLDMQRAELSRQHVRALNAQFASWVQTQFQNHPDELWEDGAQDYIKHASNIMEKFSDVVNWLNSNAAKGESDSGPNTVQKNLVSECKENNKPGIAFGGTTGVFGSSSWGSLAQKNVLSESKEINNKSSSDKLSNALAGATASKENSRPGISLANTTGIFGSSWSSGAEQNTPLGSNEIDNKSPLEKQGNATAGTTASFGNSLSSGFSFNNKTPFSFGIQTSVMASQNSIPVIQNALDKEEEDEIEQPSSPSVKKTEEKGIAVVYEVKCKLYVKPTDPADKDWKDKGMGQLSIKCKEGISKGTKESKPTIVVRNDVGKVLLNALLYPGIKTTNMQKNALAAIFHISGEGDNSDSVVARTFLIKTKTEEDRNKLAAVIQEYAPAP